MTSFHPNFEGRVHIALNILYRHQSKGDLTCQEVVTELKDCNPDYETTPREILEPIAETWLENNQ